VTVDEDFLVPQLQRVAGQADDPLDEVALRLVGVLEDDDVAATDVALGQHRPLGAG
jgi:hypothetical protein